MGSMQWSDSPLEDLLAGVEVIGLARVRFVAPAEPHVSCGRDGGVSEETRLSGRAGPWPSWETMLAKAK